MNTKREEFYNCLGDRFGYLFNWWGSLKSANPKFRPSYYENVDAADLEDYLSILSNYRNLCAHEDILFNHVTQKSISDCKIHQLLEIPKVDEEYIYGKNDIFALIIIMKNMLTYSDFKMMMNEIQYEIDWLSSRLKSIDVQKILYRMGFPENYRQISYIE
jgi:abortive infection bacteriophage resistance protein